MARPCLFNHPKFFRMTHILGIPGPHVIGHLEFLWRVAYECGDPVIGDVTDVELCAFWNGESGAFCHAALTCGGHGRPGFIEPCPENPTKFMIHDLLDHCPEYVRARFSREAERRKVKTCLHCGCDYHSNKTHSRYCCPAHRLAHHRSKNETDGNGSKRFRNGTYHFCNATPAPAPAPHINTPLTPQGGKTGGDETPAKGRRRRETHSERIDRLSKDLDKPESKETAE